MPVLLPRAAPEPGLAALAGAPQRLLVHPGEHQHAAAAGVLHDRRHQLARAQILTFHPASFSSAFSSGSRSGRSCTIEATIAASAPDLERRGEVRGLAGSARGDHRHLDGVGERARQREVVAGPRAVGVDRGDEQLAGAALDGLDGPVDGVAPARVLAGVRDDLPGLRVDRADDGLRAELVGEPGEDRRVVERGAVDGDLVGAGAQERAGVLEARDAAADRERDRQLGGRPLDQLAGSARGPRAWR